MTLCILTSNAALFPPSANDSGQFIHILTLGMDNESIAAPGLEEFSRAYNALEREFSAVLVLTASEAILPGAKTAEKAAQSHGGRTKISVLDTKQIGPGLGILARIAAQMAGDGASLAEVEEYIRAMIPHIYTLICPNNSFSGQNDKKAHPAAAISNTDLTGSQPVFSIEEGFLTPYKKIRTRRHLLENLQEFLEEFEKPQQLAYFHGHNSGLHARPLRDTASVLFPGVHFDNFDLNTPLAALFGDQTVGLTVLDM